MNDPEQPLILITGGARGIGAATAARLAARSRIVIVDRNGDEARKMANTLDGTAYELDISDEVGVKDTIARIVDQHGPISHLVNCAGPLQNPDRPERLSMRIWDRMTNVHLRGTYLITTAVGARMVERKFGSIVTVASIVGIQAGPLHAYGPAKAALINLMQGLAAEWGPDRVRVNCVSPGYVRTPATERGFIEGVIDAEVLSLHSALRRLVSVEEIAAAIEFLLVGESSAITGINLPVDAGFLAASHWTAFGNRPAHGLI